MKPNHLQSVGEKELMAGLKPLLSNSFWAYFEEYLRREQHKQVKILTSQDSHVELAKAQGRFAAYQLLATLKSQISG